MTRRALLTLALVVAEVGIIASAFSTGLEGGDRLWPVSWIAWAPVGYVILLRKPGNGVGRALLFIGTTMGLSFSTLAIAVGPFSPVVTTWAELVNSVFGVLPWLGIVWLLLVFPDGSYPGRAERLIGGLLIAFGILASAAFAFSPGPMLETGVPSPLGVPALADFTVLITGESGFLSIIVLLIASLVSVTIRWRRSSGVEREQFRWLFFGAFVFLAVLTAGQFLPDDSNALLLWLPAGFAIPVTIGIAITRYRLYEIDRIISRTLSYAILVGLLGASFFLVVTLFTRFLPSDDPLVVATATLAAAAMFNPARKRLQTAVDRQFNRSRYDAERLIEGFASSLQTNEDPDHVGTGLIEVVTHTMEPRTTSLWVRE